MNIVLLGDSYSAGNGAGNYTGVDGCYRSQNNWAMDFVAHLRDRGIAVDYQNRACSGSVTENIYKDRLFSSSGRSASILGKVTSTAEAARYLRAKNACHKNDDNEDFTTSYAIKNLSYRPSRNQTLVQYSCQQKIKPQVDFVDSSTNLVLLTIGGNDFGFANIVSECFVLHLANSCKNRIIATSDSMIKSYKTKLLTVLRSIKARNLNDEAKIVLLGYPLLSLDDNLTIGLMGNYNMSSAVRDLGRLGNDLQKQAIKEINQEYPGLAIFVDPQVRFAGHEPDNRRTVYNPHRWINELLEPGFDKFEWYHPSRTGHAQYANLLKEVTEIKLASSPICRPIIYGYPTWPVDDVVRLDRRFPIGGLYTYECYARHCSQPLLFPLSPRAQSNRVSPAEITLSRPHAHIHGPYLAKIGEKIKVDGGGSYSENGEIIRYEWDWESDGVFDDIATHYSIYRSWDKKLDGRITLRVTDSAGISGTATAWLMVSVDGDSVNQEIDNCPLVANQSQADHDFDGIGDACDEDYRAYIFGSMGSEDADQAQNLAPSAAVLIAESATQNELTPDDKSNKEPSPEKVESVLDGELVSDYDLTGTPTKSVDSSSNLRWIISFVALTLIVLAIITSIFFRWKAGKKNAIG